MPIVTACTIVSDARSSVVKCRNHKAGKVAGTVTRRTIKAISGRHMRP